MVRSTLLAVALSAATVVGMVVAAPTASAAPVDPTGVVTTVEGLNVGVSWQDGAGSGVTGYLVSTIPTSPTVTVPAGATSAVLTGIRPGIAYSVSVAAETTAGLGTFVAAPGVVRTTAPGGSFVGLPPARLLDTRSGVGAPVGATNLVALAVTGHGGVPATGVSAVALNVTVTGTTGAGFVTAYPAGQARPLASNLNFTPGYTGANLVVVPVGTGGVVDLYASVRTQLIADVAGYYTSVAAASPSSGLFHALSPDRLLDTRSGTGGSTPGAGGTVGLAVTGVGGVPATGVSAVVLNVTVVGSTGTGFVTTYPAGGTRPTASSVNFVPGQIVANRVVVPVGAGGQVSLFNSAGSTPLLADVTGWYTDGSDTSAGGAYYVPVAPHRLVDTRDGTGAPQAPIGEAGVLRVAVAGQDGLPAADAAIPPNAAALTVTVVDPTVAVYTTVYPSLAARPVASDLNADPGQDVPNLTLAALGTDGAVDVFNSHGDSDYVVDLSGYFVGAVDVPASTTTPAPGAITSVSGDPSGTATVTLAAGTPAPPIGQVISSGVTPSTPDGLLVQVIGTSTDSSGAPVLTTQPATLQQAVGDADIAVSVPLGAGDVTSSQQQADSPRAQTGNTGVIGPAQLRARSLRPADQSPITGSSDQPCSADNTSGIHVTHQFTPTLDFEAHLGHKGFTPTVSAKAGMDITEQLGASITFGGTVSCSWNTQLAQYTFEPIEFDVAGVPVVIVPVFTLTLQASATGQAQLAASVTQTFTAQAGIQDDNGTVSPYHSITNTISHTGPTLTAADATASIGVIGDLEGKLYDIAGPDASLTATLTANADPTKSPWWTLGFTLTGQAQLHFKVIIVQVDVQVDISLLSLTLAQAAGPSTGAPPVITTTNLPDAVAGQPYSTELTTADHRTGNWAITSGALPAGLSLSGFTISGTPTTIGTATFTLRFTDIAGQTVQAQATLGVEPGTGGGTFTLTITPGTMPGGQVWQPYTPVQLAASGGQGPYTWSFDPSYSYQGGMTLSSAGLLAGTPTATTSIELHVLATDSLGNVGTGTVTVPVAYGTAPTVAGTVRRLTNGNAASDLQQLSDDGNWALVVSEATNLVPSGAASPNDGGLYLINTQTGRTTMITNGASGVPGHPAMSGDGSIVAFTSDGSDLPSGAHAAGTDGVYTWARATGAVQQVATSSSGAFVLGLAAAGNRLAWGTIDANSRVHIYVTDLSDDNSTEISTDSTLDYQFDAVTFTADGSELAYTAVPTGSNYVPFVHVRDLTTNADANEDVQTTDTPEISGDGSFLAYQTYQGFFNPGQAIIDLPSRSSTVLDNGVNGVFGAIVPSEGTCMVVGSWEQTALTADLPNRGDVLYYTDVFTYDSATNQYTRVTNTYGADVSNWGTSGNCTTVAFSAPPAALNQNADIDSGFDDVYVTTVPTVSKQTVSPQTVSPRRAAPQAAPQAEVVRPMRDGTSIGDHVMMAGRVPSALGRQADGWPLTSRAARHGPTDRLVDAKSGSARPALECRPGQCVVSRFSAVRGRECWCT